MGPWASPRSPSELGLDKANAHRTLAALVRLGYVEQDPVHATLRGHRPRRRAGPLDPRFEGPHGGRRAPPQVAVGSLRREHHLAVLAGDHVVYVSTLNGTTLLSANAAIGQSGPLHCTATGKAIVANLPRGHRGGLIKTLDFEAFTPRTMTERRGAPAGAGPGPRHRLRGRRPRVPPGRALRRGAHLRHRRRHRLAGHLGACRPHGRRPAAGPGAHRRGHRGAQ